MMASEKIDNSIFPIFKEYMEKIMELARPINWTVAKRMTTTATSGDKNMDKVTICFFGECGTGKSTDLSLISKIYSITHKVASKGEIVIFESGKSVKAVTTKVKVDQSGNMTLIDTPGTNDPDKKRTDGQIQLELMNTIRALLRDEYQGITTFT